MANPSDRHLEQIIGSPSDAARTHDPDADSDRVLRAKYLDWCSARIAERFLQLTPDEIYELAQRSTGKSGEAREAVSPRGTRPSPDPGPVASFPDIVERVTEHLAATLELPTFRDWSASYRAQPSRYDEELLGLWRKGTG